MSRAPARTAAIVAAIRRSARLGWAALAIEWRAAPLAAPALAVLTLLNGGLPAATAWLSKRVLDELTTGPPTHPYHAVLLAVTAAGLGVLVVVTARLAGFVAILIGHRTTAAVERALFAKVSRFSGLRYFEDPAFHDRVKLAEEAAQTAPLSFSSFLQEALRATALVMSFAGVLFAVWPPMVLLLLAVGAVSLRAQVRQATRHAAVTENLTQVYRRHRFYRSLLIDPRAAKEIRLFGIARLLHRRMTSSLRSVVDAEVSVQRRALVVQSGLALLNAAVSGIGTVVVVAGAARGRFTVGDVTLFLAAVAGMQGAFVGITAGAGPAARAMRLFPHYLDLMNAPDDLHSGNVTLHDRAITIECRNVWFRYDPSGPWVLRGLNLLIPAGSSIGIVGVNGAGKSTLVKLLCRFYDPEHGEILWNGVDIRSCDLSWLRRRIRATFQDFMTYDLTAAENIGIGDVEHLHDVARLRRAARLAEIDATVTNLPAGYRTLLSRVYRDDETGAGVTLSGGQWQRIALARSLMRDDADVVVLDEPSSGLDAEAEYRIHQTLGRLGGGRTTILISHRLSTLRTADLIVVLADGQIAERGSHDELMAANGAYRRLFTLQAKGYQDERVGSPT